MMIERANAKNKFDDNKRYNKIMTDHNGKMIKLMEDQKKTN